MIQPVDEPRDHFFVEFIYKTLKTDHAGRCITSGGYRQSKTRGQRSRSLRNVALTERIREIHS